MAPEEPRSSRGASLFLRPFLCTTICKTQGRLSFLAYKDSMASLGLLQFKVSA